MGSSGSTLGHAHSESVINITICDENLIWEDDIIVNECGAFEVPTTLPEWVTIEEAVSVRAWDVDDNGEEIPGYVSEGELLVSWPLDIDVSPPPSNCPVIISH